MLSSRLANALVEVYLQRQVAALSDVSSLASGWMQKRVKELRDQAIAADREVQTYRAAHNILDTDKGQFNAQQLGDFSLQQTIARTRLADAQAKFDRINAITPDRLVDAPMAEAIENTVIVGLRKQYLDARRRESDWSSRYGVNHTAAANARSEMAELQGSIRNELSRISETYRSELEVAKANEAELTRQLAVLAAAAATVNGDRIMLRALQSAADSYKSIYENFLTRYTQAVQDQSFPITGRTRSTRVAPAVISAFANSATWRSPAGSASRAMTTMRSRARAPSTSRCFAQCSTPGTPTTARSSPARRASVRIASTSRAPSTIASSTPSPSSSSASSHP
jgi:succinoglycan biosynthesis transport protein ExoP